MFNEDASNDMFVNIDTKTFRDNQGDLRAPEVPIAAFELNNGANEWLGWAFRTRLCSFLPGEKPTVLASNQVLVELQ